MTRFCEAWRKAGTRRGEPPEDKLDGHDCPPSAEAGVYCVSDSGGLRTLCGNLVYRVMPYIRTLKDKEICPQCAAAVKDWRCVGANHNAME